MGYDAASLSLQEHDDADLLEIIRGHWSAIENGTHYRRDVTLGEDACRTTHRQGAEVLATLRNLTNVLYELERTRGRTNEAKKDTRLLRRPVFPCFNWSAVNSSAFLRLRRCGAVESVVKLFSLCALCSGGGRQVGCATGCSEADESAVGATQAPGF